MISVSHLSKSFGKLVVLKDISIDIDQDEVIAIIGSSSTGKSTFFVLPEPAGPARRRHHPHQRRGHSDTRANVPQAQ